MASKAVVFRNVKPLLAPGGGIFGATILATGVKRGWLARRFMDIYNRTGVLGNARDSLEGFEAVHKASFPRHTVFVRGCVAFFAALGSTEWHPGAPARGVHAWTRPKDISASRHGLGCVC